MDSVKERLTRIVESGFLPSDDPGLRLKKVALTLVPLIIGPLAFVWGSVYFLLGHPLSGSIPMAYSIISAVSLAHFFKSKSTQFIQHSQLLLVLLLPFLLMWSLGGFAAGSMVMIWAIFAPIAALMFLEKRAALYWFLAYSGLVLISALIDGVVAESVSHLPPLAIKIFFLLNLGFGSAGIYLLVSFAINEEKRSIEILSGERRKLEKSSQELNTMIQQLNREVFEREQMQAELALAMKSSDELNRMLHSVLDTIPARIFWKDRNLVYLGCNRLFAQDAGKATPREVVGVNDFDMDWRESAERYRADDILVMELGQPKLNFEEPRTHPDGSTTWLRTSKAPLHDASGAVVGVLGVYDDITEEKRISEALVSALNAAEAASRAKSEFLASMSHELRTPLNAILGFSQLLGMDMELPEPSREQAREIERAGEHLLSLVTDLIDLARIEAGKLELSMEPVLVKVMLAESLALVAPIARKQGVHVSNIVCHCDCERVAVHADYVRLRQVVINLLSNAIKYNRPQGQVTLSCQTEDGWLRINVADTGLGIPIEKQGRVFNAFDRLGEELGTVEGTGIGLVITRRIVEAMGGGIGFQSDENLGSNFWVEFPVVEPPVLPMLEERSATSASDPGEAQGNRRVVLYVEDNAMNLRLMRHILDKRPDVELRDATSAEAGIELARAHPPALILMDINLPGMDGYAALKVLKADPKTADTPVVALTANAMKGDREHGAAAGFADYLTKPINIKELFALLDRLGEPKP